MKKETMFENASNKLYEELKKEHVAFINGYDFLLDYIKEDFDDELDLSDSEYDEEKVEDYAQSVIDEFEAYLKDNCNEWMSIRSPYKWIRKKPGLESELIGSSDEDKVEEQKELTLSADEEEVLQKEEKLLNEDEYQILKNLYEKYLNTSNQERIAEIAVKMAWWNDDNDKIPFGEKVNLWDTAAEKTISAAMPGGHRWYKKAGETCDKYMDHNESVKFYEKAFEQGEKEAAESDWLIMVAKICIKNAEISREDKIASKMFIKEHDVILRDSNFPNNIGWFLYKWLFNYGESPLRVAMVAAVFIFLCAVAYSLIGIQPSIEKVPPEHSFWTSLYYSVVTFTTLGYGDFSPKLGWARFISSTEAVVGLLLTSFFLVSIYRKYTR